MNARLIIILSGLLAMPYLNTRGQELHNPLIKLTPASNTLNYKLQGKKYYVRSSPIGSEFLTDGWCIGYVILGNGDRYENLTLRLNTHLDELIEYNGRAGSAIMLDKAAISEFSLNFEDGHTELFRKIFYGKFPKGDRYFSVLYEGKFMVLLWYKTEEHNVSVYYDNQGIMRDNKFVLTKNYYLVFPDQEMNKFLFKRRSFLNLFPEQKKQIRRIIRKNHVLFDNEKEIVRVVRLIEAEIF